MTLIEVVDYSRSLLNEPLSATRTFPDDTSGFWTDTNLIRYINVVQQEVSLEIQQTFEDYFITSTNLTTTNGTAEYNLPSNFTKMKRVEDIQNSTDPIEIIPTTINQKENGRYSVFSPIGRDNNYYLRGTQIVFTSTPTISLSNHFRLYYIKRLSDLSASSDTSEIPADHHRILSWGTYRLALIQQQSDVTFADNEYRRLLKQVREFCENRQIQRSRKVNLTKERERL